MGQVLHAWHTKAELEDSALAVLHPAEYAALNEQVRILPGQGMCVCLNTGLSWVVG